MAPSARACHSAALDGGSRVGLARFRFSSSFRWAVERASSRSIRTSSSCQVNGIRWTFRTYQS